MKNKTALFTLLFTVVASFALASSDSDDDARRSDMERQERQREDLQRERLQKQARQQQEQYHERKKEIQNEDR